MKWITASQLDHWARSNSAKADLPLLVADLILASAPDVSAIRFPSGDKGQVRGLDGVLVAQTTALNVPLGESVWEMGVNVDYRAKALDDFTKRSEGTDEAVRLKTTFVFVTPRTWDIPTHPLEDWIAARLAEFAWKNLHVIDGSALETWLEACPATAAKHARFTLGVTPALGAQSTEEFWDHFSGQFEKPVSEALLLADREASAKTLLEALQGPPVRIAVQGDSSEEVIAFAVACIRSAEPATRAYLEARTILVETVDAGRQLIEASNLSYVLQGPIAGSPSQYAQRGPTLVPLGRSQRNGAAEKLARPSSHAFTQGLIAMGYDEQTAASLAKGSGKSLSALRRLRPSGQYAPPAWLSDGPDLLAAILCGGWENGNAKDRAALEALDGRRSYDEILQSYRRFLASEDAPLDHVAGSWVVRAPMDAFIEAGHLIGDDHLRRFETVARRVFSELEPEPDPNDPIGLSKIDDERHSDLLREGLATTLLLLAVWEEPAEVPIPRGEGQRLANALVRNLPGLASNERVISSLQNQLPLLAEAAPIPLLEALEHALEGEVENLQNILADKAGFLGPHSTHPPLLWALETLAWDPDYFSRAVMGLAQLDALDGGNNRAGNRPLNSLREIFLPWHPNTNAGVTLRLAVLDMLIATMPDVAWRLIKAIMPTPHGFSMPTARPRLREAGASDREEITYQSLWAHNSALVQRALGLAGSEPSRWVDLVKAMAHLSPDDRALIIGALPTHLAGWDDETREPVWSAVRELVGNHKNFAEADWALSPDQLAPLEAVVEQFRPADPLVELKRLFDRWPSGHGIQDVEAERARAIGEVVANNGLDLVLELALTISAPYVVAQALQGLPIEDADLVSLMLRAIDKGDNGLNFALSISSIIRRRLSSEAGADWFTDLATAQCWSDETTATLLLAWPDTRDTWALAENLGEPVRDIYWRKRNGFRIDGTTDDLIEAVTRYLAVGRAATALQVSLDRLDDLSGPMILSIIREIVAELNTGAASDSVMLSYYLEKAFENLDARTDVTAEDIAAAEFSVLPLIERSKRALKLNSLLAVSPEAYHALLRVVFRGESEPPQESDAGTQAQWRACYSVISQFHEVPGARPGAPMDAAQLRSWVSRVRELGQESDRAEITDVYVGHLLAHAPIDASDGAWPDAAVRALVNDLRSEAVERGLLTERFNMRGVHSRGLYDGGQQERDLASLYREWAAASAGYSRMSAVLTKMAERWDADASRQDDRAETLRLRT